MEANDQYNVIETLHGTRSDSIINDVYSLLQKGAVLTTLDAVNQNRTVCLTKYVSLLRLRHNIPVQSRWIQLTNRKRIKQFWIEKEERAI
jgi:hypothetical protein